MNHLNGPLSLCPEARQHLRIYSPPRSLALCQRQLKAGGEFLRKVTKHALYLLFVWRDSVRRDWRQHVSSRRAVRERTARVL